MRRRGIRNFTLNINMMNEVSIYKQAKLSEHFSLRELTKTSVKNCGWEHPFARTYRESEATLRMAGDAAGAFAQGWLLAALRSEANGEPKNSEAGADVTIVRRFHTIYFVVYIFIIIFAR